MTDKGKDFLNRYAIKTCTFDTLQVVYQKGHITADEFKEATGQEPEQIDICPSKTTEEKLEEAEQRIIELETQLEEQTNVNIEQDELIISILENVEG